MERDLLSRFKCARETLSQCEETLKAARQEEREAEQAILDYLDAHQASATGKYDGLGWAQINTPRLFASANQEVLPQVLLWLKAHGHESAVKETVHPSTLSQIVGEQLHLGEELPPGVTYYLKPQVKLYGGKHE